MEYSSAETLKQIGVARKTKAGQWLTFLRLATLAFIILALARPQTGESHVEVESSGIDMILVIDVSGSMQALDFRIGGSPASRLDVVKRVVSNFIEERPNDRIGIVAFAEYPYLVSPPTLDHDFLLRNLDRVKIDMENANTAIGSGLASSVNRLRETKAKSRVVVLLTDGANNAGKIQPLTAAEAAKTLGIKTYTIGAGSKGQVPFPVTDQFGRKQVVLQEMPIDEQTLEDIAHITGGKYFRATDTGSLARIYAEIDRLEKTTAKHRKYSSYTDYFQWAFIPIFLLLGTELGLATTRFKRLP